MPTKFKGIPDGSISHNDKDFTCNKNSVASAKVFKVKAGDEYLIRGEHIALHGAHGGEAEFYYACAQMEVTGNSASSIPGTSVKIPGVYKQDDPAVNFSLWGSSTAYDVTPGPDVIPGGTIRGSADGASGDVVKTVEVGASSDSAPAAEAANNQPQAQPEYSQGNPAGNNDGGCNSTYVRRHARDIVRA
ncbi:hypothetical protein ACHAP5_008803 [Fusarium lateritium]